MSKLRGFKIVKLFKWIIRPREKGIRYRHLGGSGIRKCNCMSRLFSHLLRGAKRLCFGDSNSGYIQLGEPKPAKVPQGHSVVYVGESDEMTERVVAPVVYFNHPLFGELLKKAERVYGFSPPGGITIPCRISEFEKVKMKIAAWEHYSRRKQ